MTALRCIAFTDKGFALARRLAAALDGTAVRCGGDVTLSGWTAEGFEQAKALVFVGAAGIAVRACAPCLKSKDVDPAVVAVDECARFAVPLVSGHLGGANDLARQIAALCGAQAVITTATDANGVFAVDSWAVRQGCTVRPVGGIKTVSAKLLAGENIRLRSDWPIQGTPPAGVLPVTDGPCDVYLTLAAPALAVEAEPTALVRHCTECGTGTVTTRVERTYIYSEYRECEHYPFGTDVYDVYLVEYTESCDSCSYSANWINQSKEYVYCAGFN